jgi:RNA polymerase sigma-70 factor (ECF subfamily)
VIPEQRGEEVQRLVDRLFRQQAGRMAAALTGIFGTRHVDLVEDVVQDVLVKALEQWPFHGIPEDPASWLVRAATNKALDVLRRRTSLRHKEAAILEWTRRETSRPRLAAPAPGDEVNDDQLRMVFISCHPTIPRDARVALTLKTVGGLGVSEIARAFLTSEKTITQRLVRAKRLIRRAGLSFDLPPPSEMPARLDSVLEALYLLFNEGYCAHDGDELLRADLLSESLRLASLLAERPELSLPKVHALLALMLFHLARIETRSGPAGALLVLEEQDRTCWDRSAIQRGLRHLQAAGRGAELTEYHLLAGIASCHAVSESFATTDWPRILSLYDLLVDLNPSPVTLLNRSVALAMVEGPDAGLSDLEAHQDHPSLRRYHLLPAVRGELLRRCGRTEAAVESFKEALRRGCSRPERILLERRLEDCSNIPF